MLSLRHLHNSVLSPVVCSCLVFGHRFGHRCPPLNSRRPRPWNRPGHEGASLCRWKMWGGVRRSKNKNSGVREMSSPPRLSGQTPARNRAPRLEQWPTPNTLSKMPAQAGGLLITRLPSHPRSIRACLAACPKVHYPRHPPDPYYYWARLSIHPIVGGSVARGRSRGPRASQKED